MKFTVAQNSGYENYITYIIITHRINIIETALKCGLAPDALESGMNVQTSDDDELKTIFN